VTDFDRERERMVDRQLRRRGIADERVLAAMATVPRELFVGERYRRRAYADGALPIGDGQTISQPWVVAAICEGLGLGGGERVLEIGTGSGYSTAILARLAREVVSVERIAALAEAARERLRELGADNVEVRVADGTLGAPDRAPFDAIAVHATAPAPPRSLLEQLEIGGRMVIPLTERRADMLTVLTRTGEAVDPATGEGFHSLRIAPCRFVPLVGEQGFESD
jgi:protein-L-isoaspartate(D-aspartate) O-methyltransferase